MAYKLKLSAPCNFLAEDDLDAIFRARCILETLKFTIYGYDNQPIADVGFRHAEPEELDFEFNSPEVDTLGRLVRDDYNCDMRNSLFLRSNEDDCKDVR